MPHSFTYGIHAVTTLLKKSPERLVRLYIQTSRIDSMVQNVIMEAEALHIPLKRLSPEAFNQLFPKTNHQGLAAEHFEPRYFTEADLTKWLKNPAIAPFFLVLDGVQDPHNLGACLRSADAAGVHAVIIPKDRSVGLTATVAKVACGAAETVPLVMVTNLVRTLNFLKENNVWCIGLGGEAPTSLFEFDLTGPLALVLGGEGDGLRQLTVKTCDAQVSIPMQGALSSLNVSVAAGIAMFEALRQKKRAKK
jgi:23S rRNA (guanosine2251-2'-O)-methyltransferase